MLHFLPKPLIGIISFLMYLLNTLFWAGPILLLAILKLPPVRLWQVAITYLLDTCASAWISLNNFTNSLFSKIHWDIKGLDKLSVKDWYLVVANHQSWVDILVLQKVMNRQIPFLKFFLKKELIYVPVIGLCWWALDFPFMKRYSAAFLKKYPQLKGKDIETTRKACEKFRYKPVSVMNFLEGTRFTPEKQQQQQSPFRHLLKPKAGGISFVLNAMGEHLHKLLDVTIYYPKGSPSFWDFISGKVHDIKVRVRVLPIEQHLIGDYEDPHFRERFQHWVNQLWLDKDRQLSALQQGEV
ncbi:acyltransferase [Rheinheimera sp. 4Y26]|uniref:acyltransferase n=1 Tax=Rheinheimera sp. 4Y26 TaxID=2977811 RepID=UPI0021B0DED9|nr:acyltransferase [Rheinheimera sp. 4Y26]MCT6701089.1 acyltransferase [Rheinheimera sp. 4Y26]